LASARSPRHFPIAEAKRIKLDRIASRKALQAQAQQVASHKRKFALWGIILPKRVLKPVK
jgi:hypothetical protein